MRAQLSITLATEPSGGEEQLIREDFRRESHRPLGVLRSLEDELDAHTGPSVRVRAFGFPRIR
jgi:hypothetical protein